MDDKNGTVAIQRIASAGDDDFSNEARVSFYGFRAGDQCLNHETARELIERARRDGHLLRSDGYYHIFAEGNDYGSRFLPRQVEEAREAEERLERRLQQRRVRVGRVRVARYKVHTAYALVDDPEDKE